MSATYPSQIKSFSVKKDYTDTVDAADPNTIQDEVVAIEQTLGLNPQVSTSPSPSDTFVGTSTAFASLVARLANIEKGIVGDTHTHYVKIAGGSTIQGSATNVVGITHRAITGQTANFVNFADAAGDVLGYISVAGDVKVRNVIAQSVAATMFTGMGMPVSMHLSGILTTGVKIPKFIAPMAMTLNGVYACLDLGSGATITIRINGVVISSFPTTTIGTTTVYLDCPDTQVNVGDRVQVEVTNAGTGASDLSLTLDLVTR